jgi:hypothetical protein
MHAHNPPPPGRPLWYTLLVFEALYLPLIYRRVYTLPSAAWEVPRSRGAVIEDPGSH